jgi:L-threonylcarbamoyladenylate synthase
VAFPTETFYGLAVDPRSARAVKKLFEIKRRGPDQAIPLIAADDRQVDEGVGQMTPLARRLAKRGWPGPLTLIIPASSEICTGVHLGTGRPWECHCPRAGRPCRARNHVNKRECLR